MLLVEHYVNIGDGKVPLSMAQKAADELLEANFEDSNGQMPDLVAQPGTPTAAENDAALADLMSKMGGLSG